MKRIFLFISLIVFSTELLAQIPKVLFEKTYAPTYRCGSKSLVETFDQGFLIVGWETLGDGNLFISVVRIDSVGNEVWSENYGKSWGVSNLIYAEARDVVCTPDGHYLISGEGDFEGVVINSHEFPFRNGFIFEIDDNGTLVWEQSYRLDGDNDYKHSYAFYSIDVLAGGGYVAAGYHDAGTSDEDPPRWNGYLVIINENGDKIREISYESGDKPSLEWFHDVKSTSDDGFIVSGFYSNDISVSYIPDGLVVKFDESGLEEWHYYYNTGNSCNFWGIVETPYNNFIAAGAEQISTPKSNLLIVKLSANGELIDTLILNNYDHNGALSAVKSDDGILTAGYVYQNQQEPYKSQAYLLKLNNEIGFEWELLAGSSEWEEAWSVIQTSSGEYAIAGVQIQFLDTTTYHHYLVKISKEPTIVKDIHAIPDRYDLFQNYPNPYNPSTKIDYAIPERSNVRIQVFNVLGGEVAELINGEKEAGEYSIEFNAANLPSGVYFYQLRAGSFVETRKMLLMK